MMAAALAACGEAGPEQVARAEAVPPSLSGGRSGQAGGLSWSVPAAWVEKEPGAMRAASYGIPAVSGGDAGADVSVTHFPGAGGGEEANLQRWIGQFRSPRGDPPEEIVQGRRQLAGFRVATLEVAGTYRGGPPMRGGPPRSDYRLLAAIVQGPEGPVFFKITGPTATVEATRAAFEAVLLSIRAAPRE